MGLGLVQLEILKNEIDTDPLARGYSGMSDDELVANLNTRNRDFWADLTSAQMFQALDLTEMNGLSNAKKARVDRILLLTGEIKTGPGTNARAEFIATFGPASTTIDNLVALANQPIGRGAELGIGTVGNRDLGRMRIEAVKGLI